MKILLVHSFYTQKGGEDAVFYQEAALLGQLEEVRVLEFYNKKGWRGAIQFLFSIWNITAAKKLRHLINEFNPDVIHVHNTHFAIGPIAIRVAKKKNIPVILTLHNYRLLCPSATLLFNGNIFMDSVNAVFPWKAIKNKVYRNSFYQTFWLAFIIWFHKKIGTWQMVNRYIVLTDFAKQLFINSSLGVPENKFSVKSNFVKPPVDIPLLRNNSFLFVGRLSEEKGIKVLLETFKLVKYKLRIAGDGPLKDMVLNASAKNANIQYLGSLNKKEIELAMQQCTALVFPSIWYETFGLVIIEAFSLGTPIIASDIGSPVQLIQNGINGLLFKVGNTTDLKNKLDDWQALNNLQKERFQNNAFIAYKTKYTPEENKAQLINIYSNTFNPII